ncbi:MAG: hypothetical protein QM775_34185 [Pirellulales bacterium]
MTPTPSRNSFWPLPAAALVRIVLRRDDDGAFHLHAPETGGSIDWSFRPDVQLPVDFPSAGFGARLERLVGTATLNPDRWVVTTQPESSTAYALGFTTTLAGEPLRLESDYGGGRLSFALAGNHNVSEPWRTFGPAPTTTPGHAYEPIPSAVSVSIENGTTVRLWDTELETPLATLVDSHAVTHVRTTRVPIRSLACASAGSLDLIDLEFNPPRPVLQFPVDRQAGRSVLLERDGDLLIATADAEAVLIGRLGEPPSVRRALPRPTVGIVSAFDLLLEADEQFVLLGAQRFPALPAARRYATFDSPPGCGPRASETDRRPDSSLRRDPKPDPGLVDR